MFPWHFLLRGLCDENIDRDRPFRSKRQDGAGRGN